MLTKKGYRELLAMLCSLYCTFTLSDGFLVGGNPIINGRSVEAPLFCIMFFVTCRYCFQITDQRKTIVAAFTADVLAIFMFIGAEFENYHTILMLDLSLIINFGGLFVVLWCAVILGFKAIESFGKNKILGQNDKINKKRVFSIWLGIIVIWIPVFLAVYPGIYSYDASLQILEVYGGQGLASHHPIIHTLLLNACLFLGNLLFNDFNAGIAIYSIAQASIVAAVFANICNKMIQYHVSNWIIVGTFIWAAFNPINQIFAFITTKDVLFTAFFIWCITLSIEMLVDDSFFVDRKKMCEFYLSAVLMILFRKQGKYIFLLFIIAGLVTLKLVRKRFLLISLAVIVTTSVLTGPLSQMARVREGSVREALCVPLQQLARVYNICPDYYTENDLTLLYGLISKENWEAYEPEIADLVKGGFNDDFWSENKFEIAKLWARTGRDNLLLYVESFLYGSYGYWYVDSSPRWQTYIFFDGFFMEPELNILNIARDSKLPAYEEYLRQISYNLIYENIPIIAIILNQGFPFWCMVIAAGYIIYIKKYRLLCVLVWTFGLWGTILLGPVICVRYAYPLMAALPTLGMIIYAQYPLARTDQELAPFNGS